MHCKAFSLRTLWSLRGAFLTSAAFYRYKGCGDIASKGPSTPGAPLFLNKEVGKTRALDPRSGATSKKTRALLP